MHYEAASLVQGKSDLIALKDDTPKASTYADAHLAGFAKLDGGKLYQGFLDEHDNAVAQLDELLAGLRTLLGNAAGRVEDTMDLYDDNEQANVDAVSGIWNVLSNAPDEPPVERPTDGGVTPGPLPSATLETPDTQVGHWIFDILSWPDYLSIGSWARRIFGWIWSAFTGKDPWQDLWSWLGGDWESVGLASDAWKNLSNYVDNLSEELTTRMQIMFQGWYDSPAATSCGTYFAQAAEAIDSSKEPLSDLATLCNDVAWSSYFLCQAVYSLVDAAIDAIVAYLMGGMTLLEAIAAFFSGGVTAIPAAASAVIAAVEAISAAWGAMMTVVYAIGGLSALLGAAVTDVTWVAVPEG